MKSGIVILSELHGPIRDRILEIQRRFDPRLAAGVAPHLTLTGSSGMGPIPTDTTVDELRRALEPVALETPPMTLTLLPPLRFMQTNVVVLPLDPNGPVRALHERIKRSGLAYEQPRFTFTPHVTLSFFRELSSQDSKALLALRVPGPITVDRISAHRTVGIVNSEKLIELLLSGTSPSRNP
ncbi:MAG: 2'-5' RNA ligase family protein [Gemmatimonadaceae bacterium]